MLLQKMSFNIDWKRKTLHIYHDNDEAEQIVVDEHGSGELVLDMFKALNITPLKDFMVELDEVLTKEQKQQVFYLWGNTRQIMLSDMSRIMEDKQIARKILALGMDRGVLGRGVNCTWKVIDLDIQKTMKEVAEKMKRGPIKGPMTTEEAMVNIQRQREKLGIDSEEGSQEAQSQNNESVENETTVEVIPKEPIKKPNVELQKMQAEMVELQRKYADPKLKETAQENKHTLVDKINILKVKIHNAQLIKTPAILGTKLTESGSVTRLTPVDQARPTKNALLPVTKKRA